MTASGRHLAFPFRIGRDGRTVPAGSTEEHVRDELIQLLLTDPGERAYLPEFGGGVRRLVFEPVDEAAQGLTKARITRSLSNWLGPRAELEDVDVVVAGETLVVEIRYRVAGDAESRVMRLEHPGGGPS